MRNRFGLALIAGLLLAAGTAFGQTAPTAPTTPAASSTSAAQAAPSAQPAAAKLEFDVASVRPSAPLDLQKLAAEMQAGKMPRMGPHVDGLRAEYIYLTLKDLITVAYKVKPYQITGPAWLATDHFDVVAKMPEGSTKDDAPKMLQTLLADRFKVVIHRETQEHPVLALVVGKDGPKLKDSPGTSAPIDEDAPLAKGEMKMDTQDGPARMTMNRGGMGATINMGTKGIITWGADMQTMTLHVTSTNTTMTLLADVLTQLMAQMGGQMSGADAGSRQVMDMTGLKGNYEVAMDFSMADMIAQARAQAGAGGGGAGGGSSAVASDPGGGGQTVSGAIEKLGLKLESRKSAVVQQLDRRPAPIRHRRKTRNSC
jgi:uncharacterized protein (TIGR03435 family)